MYFLSMLTESVNYESLLFGDGILYGYFAILYLATVISIELRRDQYSVLIRTILGKVLSIDNEV